MMNFSSDKTATVLQATTSTNGLRGLVVKTHYHLSEPLATISGTERSYVIASSTNINGVETIIFPADESGEILDYSDTFMNGDSGFFGDFSTDNHKELMERIGYRVIDEIDIAI